MPGGGLAAHEAAGGHTLAKHVGKSEEFLRTRLATEPNIRGASTFYDRQVAENSISGLLRAQQRTVDRWRAGHRDVLMLEDRLPVPAGTLMPRGYTDSHAVHGIKIVLRRNAEIGSGYLLITAMVIE
ncbi:MAG TPA: RNase A-like domain-containing protein [Jatrophihabitans sp.]|uniref:RNase A-like domain-containing protein n=1 Tax=Jatrophihabitans sp. TaxID=1932789 RepID=UPI002F075EE9